MKLSSICRILLSLAVLAPLTPLQSSAATPRPAVGRVDVIELHDTLQPVRARIFAGTIERANSDGSLAVIVDLSTPGGLDYATDGMVNAMRASRIPVIVWVDSTHTRVSGEGLRLLAEADVSLMSPGSYLTPLWTEPTRQISAADRASRSTQVASSLAGSLAAHARSSTAVDELAAGIHWFSAPEALAAGFIDGMATTPEDVLRFIATHPIHRRSGAVSMPNLATAGLYPLTTGPKGLLLLALMNPDLAVLLLTLGLLLIYLEINTPGTVIPGAAGLTVALLACYTLHMLPLSSMGLWLCALAIALLLLESRVPRHGIFAAPGVLSLAVGLGLLVRGPVPQLEVSWGTAVGAGLGFGGVTACLLVLGAEARRAKVKTGAEAMLGWLAVAQTPLCPDGKILVRGELWNARMTSNDSFVAAGDRVKVLRADGLTLEVTAVPLTQFS